MSLALYRIIKSRRESWGFASIVERRPPKTNELAKSSPLAVNDTITESPSSFHSSFLLISGCATTQAATSAPHGNSTPASAPQYYHLRKFLVTELCADTRKRILGRLRAEINRLGRHPLVSIVEEVFLESERFVSSNAYPNATYMSFGSNGPGGLNTDQRSMYNETAPIFPVSGFVDQLLSVNTQWPDKQMPTQQQHPQSSEVHWACVVTRFTDGAVDFNTVVRRRHQPHQRPVARNPIEDSTVEPRCPVTPYFPEDVVLDYLNQLIQALSHLHRRGVIHGDLRLANVFLQPDNTVLLCGYGSMAGFLRRTAPPAEAAFCPPEAAKSEDWRPNEESDCWQLGLVLHTLLTLKRPQMTTANVTTASGSVAIPEHPYAVPRVSKAVAKLYSPRILDFMNRCLAADPTERPALTSVLDSEPLFCNLQSSLVLNLLAPLVKPSAPPGDTSLPPQRAMEPLLKAPQPVVDTLLKTPPKLRMQQSAENTAPSPRTRFVVGGDMFDETRATLFALKAAVERDEPMRGFCCICGQDAQTHSRVPELSNDSGDESCDIACLDSDASSLEGAVPHALRHGAGPPASVTLHGNASLMGKSNFARKSESMSTDSEMCIAAAHVKWSLSNENERFDNPNHRSLIKPAQVNQAVQMLQRQPAPMASSPRVGTTTEFASRPSMSPPKVLPRSSPPISHPRVSQSSLVYKESNATSNKCISRTLPLIGPRGAAGTNKHQPSPPARRQASTLTQSTNLPRQETKKMTLKSQPLGSTIPFVSCRNTEKTAAYQRASTVAKSASSPLRHTTLRNTPPCLRPLTAG